MGRSSSKRSIRERSSAFTDARMRIWPPSEAATGTPIPIDDPVPWNRGDPGTRGQNAHQVQGIAGGHNCIVSMGFPAAQGAQGVERFGQSKLLPVQTCDKPPATDFSAGLRPAKNREKFPPERSRGFPHEQFPAEHPIAAHVLLRPEIRPVARAVACGFKKRPSPCAGPPRLSPAPAGVFHSPGFAGYQSSKRCEGIGRYQTGSHKLPERVFHF